MKRKQKDLRLFEYVLIIEAGTGHTNEQHLFYSIRVCERTIINAEKFNWLLTFGSCVSVCAMHPRRQNTGQSCEFLIKGAIVMHANSKTFFWALVAVESKW